MSKKSIKGLNLTHIFGIAVTHSISVLYLCGVSSVKCVTAQDSWQACSNTGNSDWIAKSFLHSEKNGDLY